MTWSDYFAIVGITLLLLFFAGLYSGLLIWISVTWNLHPMITVGVGVVLIVLIIPAIIKLIGD